MVIKSFAQASILLITGLCILSANGCDQQRLQLCRTEFDHILTNFGDGMVHDRAFLDSHCRILKNETEHCTEDFLMACRQNPAIPGLLSSIESHLYLCHHLDVYIIHQECFHRDDFKTEIASCNVLTIFCGELQNYLNCIKEVTTRECSPNSAEAGIFYYNYSHLKIAISLRKDCSFDEYNLGNLKTTTSTIVTSSDVDNLRTTSSAIKSTKNNLETSTLKSTTGDTKTTTSVPYITGESNIIIGNCFTKMTKQSDDIREAKDLTRRQIQSYCSNISNLTSLCTEQWFELKGLSSESYALFEAMLHSHQHVCDKIEDLFASLECASNFNILVQKDDCFSKVFSRQNIECSIKPEELNCVYNSILENCSAAANSFWYQYFSIQQYYLSPCVQTNDRIIKDKTTKSSANKGLLAGVISAGVLLIIIACILIYILYRRRKHTVPPTGGTEGNAMSNPVYEITPASVNNSNLDPEPIYNEIPAQVTPDSGPALNRNNNLSMAGSLVENNGYPTLTQPTNGMKVTSEPITSDENQASVNKDLSSVKYDNKYT